MTEEERNELLAYIEEFKNKIAGNRELSLQFLAEVGICTLDGKLTEPYKNLYFPKIKT